MGFIVFKQESKKSIFDGFLKWNIQPALLTQQINQKFPESCTGKHVKNIHR